MMNVEFQSKNKFGWGHILRSVQLVHVKVLYFVLESIRNYCVVEMACWSWLQVGAVKPKQPISIHYWKPTAAVTAMFKLH